ncbi:MAG TPA: glycosyltransferase [Patescibacteria group bacterium]|nr:glycosyltransferase [Patescibacteria group bacterium]
MRVALVHDFLTQYGGAEKVLSAFSEIWPKAPIYTLFYDKKEMRKAFSNKDIRVSPIQNLPFAKKKYRWYLPLMPSAVERFNLSHYDLVISDSSAYSKGVITRPSTTHISYIHSPTRYLWSDTYTYLESLSGVERLVKKFLPPILTLLRQWDVSAAQRPDYLISNSNFVSKRIKNYYFREPEKVIYPPVEAKNLKISKEIGDYFLIISRFRPYKRVDLAIKAFNKLKIPLKVVGTGNDKNLKKIAGPNIEFLGFVSEEKKAELLSKARAFIHPQKEDFGITAVESMASGRPVIAYKKGGALDTVVEGKTGLFFKEQTCQCLVKKVKEFENMKFDPEKIRKHALGFSKESFKKQIKEFVEKHV